jgi:hypothetical protein
LWLPVDIAIKVIVSSNLQLMDSLQMRAKVVGAWPDLILVLALSQATNESTTGSAIDFRMDTALVSVEIIGRTEALHSPGTAGEFA